MLICAQHIALSWHSSFNGSFAPQVLLILLQISLLHLPPEWQAGIRAVSLTDPACGALFLDPSRLTPGLWRCWQA